MPIDITSETLISLPEAARRIPGKPNLSTVHRWRLAGVRGQRIETVLVGGRRFTSVESIERFLAALNGGAVVTPRLAAADDRRAVQTAAALATRHGIRVGAPA